MIGGMSGVEKDIIPYGLYTGIRENLKGFNLIGLKRKGIDNKSINNLNKIVKKIFKNNNTIIDNISKLNESEKNILEIQEIITDFINKNPKKRVMYITK